MNDSHAIDPTVDSEIITDYVTICRIIVLVAKKPRTGRPPTGLRGEKTTSYPKLTVRLPPETLARLEAVSALRRQPIWRVIDAAVSDHLKAASGAERSLVAEMVNRMLREGSKR
jgi:hypothetical protein